MPQQSVYAHINEIWVHQACTTWPGTDTVWIMFAKYEDGNPPEYAPAQRYAIGMRVKKHRAPNGGVDPYKRVYGHVFEIDKDRHCTFAFLMVNQAGGDGDAATVGQDMRRLMEQFHASQLDTFASSGQPNNDHSALDLVRVIAANALIFNIPGMIQDVAGWLKTTYFTNRDAPIAYDRVSKPAGTLQQWERFARDYHGARSQYGVAFILEKK